MNNESEQLRLKRILNDGPMTSYQVGVVAICFILNFNDGIDVSVVSFTASEIASQWSLSNTQLGYLFSAGLVGMTVGSFLLAPFGDKIGRIKTFLISLLLISTGMICVYFSQTYWQVLFCRLITGLGIGGILPNLATLVSEFSNQKNRDFNVGFLQAGWPLGSILTGFVTAWAVPEFGWQFMYLIAGLIAFVMLVAVYFLLPESLIFLVKHQPKNAKEKINEVLHKIKQPQIKEMPGRPDVQTTPSIKNLFIPELKKSNFLLWAAIFFGFLTLYTVLSWVPTIAKDSGMPFEIATYLGATLNVGSFSGVVVMGLSIRHFGLRNVIVTFMSLAFMVMVIFGNLDLGYVAMFVLTFLIGFLVQGGFNSFYPASTRIYAESIRSTGVGLAMGVGRFGAILGPAVFGILSDAGFSLAARFTIFSVPLLIAAYLAYTIPSKNLN
jgi:MFS transporter, AAHS family, 4-hydroxybenzoate transporter